MKRTAVSLVVLALAISAHAQLFPARPDKTYVADSAHVLTAQDSATITKESKALLKATGAPIVVATVKSLGSVDAESLGVEKYAQKMFDTWRIGTKNNNRGILIVLAKDDHKARIEFGKSWAHKYDGSANTIMQTTMIPAFRTGNYSKGLASGVKALAALAKGIKAAQPTRVAAAAPAYSDQSSDGSLPITYNGESSPSQFDFPGTSQGFNPTWLLVPLGCMFFPFLIVIGLIISGVKRGATGSGMRNHWNNPNNTFNDPFSNSHHHHHNNFGSGNSSSSSDSSSSSNSGSSSSSDSGGSSGGGGSTGSW